MKIAQICPYDFSRPGGVKAHIESLTEHLITFGHEVKIIAPNIHADLVENEQVHFFGRNRSVNLAGTKIDVNIAVNEELQALKCFLKEEHFDLIHFHTIWNPILPAQVRLNSRSKHVATFHDTPKNLLIGKTLMPLAARLIFPFIDSIISVSETQAAFINRFSSRIIDIIPNGIDLAHYRQDIQMENKYRDGKFNMLFLARLEPRKGLIYALECFKALKQKHPNLRLIIAGDGDERQLAENFIRENQLPDVGLLGFVSEKEKIQLLKTADLFLAPSVFGESFGIVLLEAMAIGTPMTGFANAGYKNVLTKEMLPYFPSPRDIDSLIAATDSLISDPEKSKQLSQEGLKEVKKYDWKTISKKIESIYLNTMQNTP